MATITNYGYANNTIQDIYQQAMYITTTPRTHQEHTKNTQRTS